MIKESVAEESKIADSKISDVSNIKHCPRRNSDEVTLTTKKDVPIYRHLSNETNNGYRSNGYRNNGYRSNELNNGYASNGYKNNEPNNGHVSNNYKNESNNGHVSNNYKNESNNGYVSNNYKNESNNGYVSNNYKNESNNGYVSNNYKNNESNGYVSNNYKNNESNGYVSNNYKNNEKNNGPKNRKNDTKYRYETFLPVNGILGFVVNVYDPLSFDIDLKMNDALKKRYENVIQTPYSYIDTDADGVVREGVAYRCRLKGVISDNNASENNSLLKEYHILMIRKTDEENGWVRVSVSDVDVYRRILITLHNPVTGECLNNLLLGQGSIYRQYQV